MIDDFRDILRELVAVNISAADFRKPDVVVQLGIPLYRIDILTSSVVTEVSHE